MTDRQEVAPGLKHSIAGMPLNLICKGRSMHNFAQTKHARRSRSKRVSKTNYSYLERIRLGSANPTSSPLSHQPVSKNRTLRHHPDAHRGADRGQPTPKMGSIRETRIAFRLA